MPGFVVMLTHTLLYTTFAAVSTLRGALAVVTVLVMLRWSISPPLLIFAGAVLGLALGR